MRRRRLGGAIRRMFTRRAAVVTGEEETARFPEHSCIRVDSGPAEVDMLAEFMLWIARFPSDARAVGDFARPHIGEHHDGHRLAQIFWDVPRSTEYA